MAMKPRKILRRKEAMSRLGCGLTKFTQDYQYHNEADPYVPGTQIPRLRSISLGPRFSGFLEHKLDELIDALADAGGHRESVKYKKAQAPPSAKGRKKPTAAALSRKEAAANA
jgi:hypothetical protein